MNGLENIRHISFHCRETGFVEFDTSRPRFLEADDQFSHSRYVEFCLDGAECLQTVPSMSHLVVCVLHYTFGKDGFSANQQDSDARSETFI